MRTKRNNTVLYCLTFFLWIFYVWMAAQTPYGIDDWSWGLPIGIERWLTASLNSRYIGNLFEIIVSRSPFLKALLVGTLSALLPLICTFFAETVYGIIGEPGQVAETRSLLFMTAAVLFLTVPKAVWRQTYGWIAGFSNHGLSTVLLICFQLLLLRCAGEYGKKKKLAPAFALPFFLFGVMVQLVVENVSCYIVIMTVTVGAVKLMKKEKAKPCFVPLLAGTLCGTVLMFSSGIYSSLLHTGIAMDGLRSISINTNGNLISGMLSLYRRFVYIFPANIWGNNWIICSTISALLLICWSKTRLRHKWLRLLFCMGYGMWLLYFICIQTFGPLEDYVGRWNYVLSQRMNLLFFWITLFSTFFLFRNRPRCRRVLICLWLSAPLIVLPLAVTELDSGASRCYLVCIALLIEYTLILISAIIDRSIHKKLKVFQTAVAAVLLAIVIQKSLIYYDIGAGMRKRDSLILQAREGEVAEISFPDYPHGEYLWTMEPVGEEQRAYFREFYQIPENVFMRFNTIEFTEAEVTENEIVSD